MEALGLTAFDAAALAVIIISAIMAFLQGLLREVFSIVALIGGALAALYGLPFVSPMFQGWISPPLLAELAAALTLFLVVFIAITAGTSLVTRLLHKSSEIGALDRGAGLLFGIARGMLVLSLLVLILRAITGAPQAPMPGWIANARLYPAIAASADFVERAVPRVRAYIPNEKPSESDPPAP